MRGLIEACGLRQPIVAGHDVGGQIVFALLRDDYECGPIPNLPLRALDVSGHDLL
jgi:pimeloyl-ACP methyl ester carboxylesterase